MNDEEAGPSGEAGTHDHWGEESFSPLLLERFLVLVLDTLPTHVLNSVVACLCWTLYDRSSCNAQYVFFFTIQGVDSPRNSSKSSKSPLCRKKSSKSSLPSKSPRKHIESCRGGITNPRFSVFLRLKNNVFSLGISKNFRSRMNGFPHFVYPEAYYGPRKVLFANGVLICRHLDNPSFLYSVVTRNDSVLENEPFFVFCGDKKQFCARKRAFFCILWWQETILCEKKSLFSRVLCVCFFILSFFSLCVPLCSIFVTSVFVFCSYFVLFQLQISTAYLPKRKLFLTWREK